MLVTNQTSSDIYFGPLHLGAGIGTTLTVDDTSATSLYLTDDSAADALNNAYNSGRITVSRKHPSDTAAAAAVLSLLVPGAGGVALEALSVLASGRALVTDIENKNYTGAAYDVLAIGGFGLARTAEGFERVAQARLKLNSEALAQLGEDDGMPFDAAERDRRAQERNSLRTSSNTLRAVVRVGKEFEASTSLSALVAPDGKRRRG